MSGRVVWWRDGAPVTGFRKTDRRIPRLPKGQLPEWTLRAELPHGVSLSPQHKHGLIGLSVQTNGITVIGCSESWVVGQACNLLRSLGWSGKLKGTMARTYGGTTQHRSVTLDITGHTVRLSDKQSMRQLHLAF